MEDWAVEWALQAMKEDGIKTIDDKTLEMYARIGCGRVAEANTEPEYEDEEWFEEEADYDKVLKMLHNGRLLENYLNGRF